MAKLALISFILTGALFTQARAQSTADPGAPFVPGSFTASNQTTLAYRVLFPERLEPNRRYPLIIWLHGAGEVGSDDVKHLVHGVEVFADPTVRSKYPAIVLVPQCPEGDRWTLMGSKTQAGQQHLAPEPTRAASAAFELIEKVVHTYPVDKSHVSLIGFSMGGFGTWDWLARRPDLFTAALPMSGGGDTSTVGRFAGKKILATHGDRDDTVNVRQTEVMIEALRASGGKPAYQRIPDTGHGDWEFVMQNPQILRWIFEEAPRGGL